MVKEYWLSKVPEIDDFGNPIHDVFVDGRTPQGPWAIMTLECHKYNGMGLGLGRGQLYRKQVDGKWLKVKR